MRKRRLFNLFYPNLGLRSRAVVMLIILSIAFSSSLVRANDPNQVALVIVHGNEDIITRCIEFSEEKISGYEVLERSGFDLNADLTSGMGAAVCRIDNEGCTYPEEKCFCQCSGGGECTFWSYWYLSNDQWQFSTAGASNYNASHGDVQGWIWGEGIPNKGASPPPLMTFDEICKAPTPTPSPTPTHTPTHTPPPTDTPEATDTPEPEPTPNIKAFSADRVTIVAGESVTLSWDLSGARAVYLRYDGVEEGVAAPGSKTIMPGKTTVYTLIAYNDDDDKAVAELTVTVNPVPTVSAPADSPSNQAIGQQAQSPTDTPTPAMAAPSPGEPAINLSAASTTLPAGACTTLYWQVANAEIVYLDQVEVGPKGSQQACPRQTRLYQLRAVSSGGERTAQLKLEVVDPVSFLTAAPSATVEPTLELIEATAVSQITDPTVVARPVQKDMSAQSALGTPDGWSGLAKLGLWSGLVGGWCVIALVGMIAWGGFWWLSRRHKQQ